MLNQRENTKKTKLLISITRQYKFEKFQVAASNSSDDKKPNASRIDGVIRILLFNANQAFFTNSDFNFIAPTPSILQSIL